MLMTGRRTWAVAALGSLTPYSDGGDECRYRRRDKRLLVDSRRTPSINDASVDRDGAMQMQSSCVVVE